MRKQSNFLKDKLKIDLMLSNMNQRLSNKADSNLRNAAFLDVATSMFTMGAGYGGGGGVKT